MKYLADYALDKQAGKVCCNVWLMEIHDASLET
jgi:hypothetical protein